jgi:hypothetical protein
LAAPAQKNSKITKKPQIKRNPKALAIIKERSQTGTIQEIVDEIFNRTGYDYSNNTVKKYIAKIKMNK